jgi:hypothetical protein
MNELFVENLLDLVMEIKMNAELVEEELRCLLGDGKNAIPVNMGDKGIPDGPLRISGLARVVTKKKRKVSRGRVSKKTK